MNSDNDNENNIIKHNGNEIKNYNYELKIACEEVFRLNHLDQIQDLYDEIREYLEANYTYHPKMSNLQDFIDFCMENSCIEEELNDSDPDNDAYDSS